MEALHFKTQEAFREWLVQNHTSEEGFWLLFGKTKDLETLKAREALEEALCFGWIDGLMKRVDDTSYIKYFSARRKNSNWSEKNKAIVEELERQGRMTAFGRAKIEEAKKNGQWESAGKTAAFSTEQLDTLAALLKEHETAYLNFQAMAPSVQKTYTRAYFDAKTAAGRAKRLTWMIDRLERNLKPM